MGRVFAFIVLSRLHFLAGGALLFALGALIARDISASQYIAGQALVTAAQITAHYVNEYADYEADMRIANRTSFSGGSGVLVSGALGRMVALRAGQVSTVVCIVTAIVVARFSLAAAVLGLVALSISWAYSMPPVRLLATGTGELFASITVAGIVPLTGCLCQQSHVPAELWWIMAALTSVHMTMLLGFELPDLDTDAIAEKRVLGVRLGRARTKVTMLLCVAISASIIVTGRLSQAIAGRTALGATAGLPVLVLLAVAIRRRSNPMTALGSVAAFVITSLGIVLSLA